MSLPPALLPFAPLLTTAAVLAVGIACVWLYAYMRFIEPSRVEISRFDVVSSRLPPALDGLVICQVSDLHISAKPRNGAAIAEAIRSVQADLYVLTGDMVLHQAGIRAFFHWLDGLGESIRPAVAILGNAEHKEHVRTEDLLEGFAERNIPLLNNRSLRFRVRGTELQIVGVDDPHTLRSDFEQAYVNANPEEWTLLLCHSPDGLAEIGARRADLMLCGHTHGGQVCLPAIGALKANTKRVRGFVAGWFDREVIRKRVPSASGVERLYVSRGLGMTGPPLRLLCRPEVVVVTLRPG